MTDSAKYSIHLDPKFDFLELVDVSSLIETCEDEVYSQTLCKVNDSVVRLGIIQGELHWHKHDEEDEFFFVLEGEFLIDLEGETVTLERHQGYAIPKGVVHRTRASERAAILMFEKSTVKPAGDN